MTVERHEFRSHKRYGDQDGFARALIELSRRVGPVEVRDIVESDLSPGLKREIEAALSERDGVSVTIVELEGSGGVYWLRDVAKMLVHQLDQSSPQAGH